MAGSEKHGKYVLGMGMRIRQYLGYVDEFLDNPPADCDLQKEIERHLRQIAFFSHERFIHLIVMCLFAVGAVMTFLVVATTNDLMAVLLLIMLLVLLVPYVKHYYLMENSVQIMYEQYDRMLAMTGDKVFKADYDKK